MLQGKQIPSLIGNKLVQVDQTVKKYPYILLYLFQLLQVKMAFRTFWLHHVVHLTQQIHEKYWLMIQVFQSMHLFFVEVFHFVRRYYLIVIEVYHLEPIGYTSHSRFIFFAEHKPYKIFIIHFVFSLTLEFSRHLIEDAINSLSGKCMTLIP